LFSPPGPRTTAPGRHEHEKDQASLKACLDNSNVKNVSTQLYSGKVPDVSELKNAAVLVMESSGDRTPTEHHVLFPQDATTDHQVYSPEMAGRLKQIDALVQKRVGHCGLPLRHLREQRDRPPTLHRLDRRIL